MAENTKEKLSIAMICDPIGSNKSGVVVSTLRFSKLLKERGHNVIFIGAKSKEHGGHSYHDEVKAYRYRSLPIPKSGGWYTAFPTVGELKKVFKEEKIKPFIDIFKNKFKELTGFDFEVGKKQEEIKKEEKKIENKEEDNSKKPHVHGPNCNHEH